jgi:hypothetical protein
MAPATDTFVERIRDAEAELVREVTARRRRWHYEVHRGRVRFDREVRRAHKRLRQGVLPFLWHSDALSVLTAPVVYSLAIPLLALDLWTTVYQWVCFPVFGIPRVRRRAYFVIDRHKLAYLNAIEKVHCTYCSYANGLLAYVREVAARTEQYWCPIKHARVVIAPHRRYRSFLDYGDAGGYRRELPAIRASLRVARAHRRRRGN